MPLFEVDARRSTLVQPLAPSDTGFVEQAAPVVDDHISRLLGEQIFPVLERGPGVRREDAPHLLALDASGQPVVLEMVSRLDAASLTLALAHAGRAGRLTRADVAERFPEGVRQFERAFAAFRDGAPIARTRGQREGARLLLLCAQVDSAVTDALDFLRLTSQAVTVLRLGVVTGPDGRRLVEVEPLHSAARRGRGPAQPASSAAQAAESTAAEPTPAEPTPAAQPAEPTPAEPPTPVPPRRTSTRSARLPTPPGDLARAAIAMNANGGNKNVTPALPSVVLPPTSSTPAPAPAPSAASGAAASAASDASLFTPRTEQARTPLPTRRSRAARRDAEGPHPTEQQTDGLDRTTVLGSTTLPARATPPAAPRPTTSGASTPTPPTRTPLASRSFPSPGAPPGTPATSHLRPRPDGPDDATRISALSAPLPVPERESPLVGGPSDDDPDLFMLAQNIGRPTPLVWARPRRGQRFEAVLLPTGQIEIPGRGRYRNPDAAASAVVGQTREDGWDVWRLGVAGPSLTDVFREQFA